MLLEQNLLLDKCPHCKIDTPRLSAVNVLKHLHLMARGKENGKLMYVEDVVEQL